MSTATVIYIILAAIAAAGLAFYFYYIGKKRATPYPWLFGLLRFVTLFAVFLLLINPQFKQESYYTEKPELLLAVDNSASIEHFGAADAVSDFVNSVATNADIQDRFSVNTYTFGEELRKNDTLNFSENQTNIHRALFSLGRLYRDKTAPTVLITDGNQTYGQDYSFYAARANQTIIPVLVGDTTSYVDVSINQLNANRYAFLENQFPVEVILNYNIETPQETRFVIQEGNSTVFSETLNLDPEANSRRIEIHLPASSIGLKSFTARVENLPNERNTLNNSKKFAVEVIDERTQILVLTNISHPDLGAMKRAVEANQQRSLNIKNISSGDYNLDDTQLVVLYQPDNNFRSVFEEIRSKNLNYFVVTGLQTDWQFLNNAQNDFQKEITRATENYFPLLNKNYTSFQIQKNPFPDYPPLDGFFGDVQFNAAANIILFQKVAGIETNEPLLATIESNSVKKGILLGENLWKWRAENYANTGSFQDFDDFFGKVVQYLSSNQKKERLTLSYEPFYHENDKIIVSAQYFDENYQFDARQQLVFQFRKNEGDLQRVPFILRNNNYEVNLTSLAAGEYDFTVNVEGKSVSRSGSFEILDFGVEQQFLNSDLSKMKQLATEQGEELFFISEKDKLIQNLLNDNRFTPIQKSETTTISLIEWYYLLILIVSALTAEWFLRKYHGLI